MTTFPSLVPSSRTFTPGEYPATAFSGFSGNQNRVKHSNVFLAAQMRLSFLGLSQAQMLDIWNHYNGRRGEFRSFALPSEVVSYSSITNYVPGTYLWRYAGPGLIEDLPCGGHNVSLTLETVPPIAASVVGSHLALRLRLSAGTANGGEYMPGISEAVTFSVAAGTAFTALNGINQIIEISISAGTATGDAGVSGIDKILYLGFAIQVGVNAGALGIDKTIDLSLAADGADNGIEIAARYWRITNLSVIASTLELSELQFFDGTTRRTGTYSFQTAPTVGIAYSDLGNGNLNESLYWSDVTAESTSFWIKIDLGTPATVTGIRQARLEIANRHISAFTLQYSGDDITWTTLGSASGIPDPDSTTLSALIEVS